MASENKITKKDLNKMALMSLFEQSCFSFERMQAVGFAWGMSGCFRRIFKDNNEEMAKALQNNLDFINTEPHMAAILQGLIVSMEESGQDRELIHSIITTSRTGGILSPYKGTLLRRPFGHRGLTAATLSQAAPQSGFFLCFISPAHP